MSYSIIRVAKVKGKTNTTGIQKHVQRENKNYENLDIDLEKSHLNYDLVNDEPIEFNSMIDEKIEENYTGNRKIRSDAVKHVDGIITSDNEFFNFKSQQQIQAFFEDSKQFLEDEYGKDNLLYATVHMDEKTPHMHYGVVPITDDGRLSAKDVVGNKKALTEFQDRFNQYLNDKGHNLERGESKHKTERKHKQVERYKSETQYHGKEKNKAERLAKGTERKVRAKEQLLKRYDKQLQPMKKQYDEMKNEVDGWEKVKIPKLKQKAKELNNQNAQESRKIDDLKQKQDDLISTFEKIDSDIEKYKEQREHEKALRDQIRADKEKEEEQYQNLVKVLNEPINDEYEYEYKKPSIFSKEKEPTGKVIISEDDYKILKQRSALAARLEPTFTELNSGKERKQDKEHISRLQDENSKLKKQNKKVANERDEVIREHKSDISLVKSGCKIIKQAVGEDVYHKGINMIDNKVKSNFKDKYREMVIVDDNDKRMFQRKDNEVKRMQFENSKMRSKGKGKGFDLDR